MVYNVAAAAAVVLRLLLRPLVDALNACVMTAVSELDAAHDGHYRLQTAAAWSGLALTTMTHPGTTSATLLTVGRSCPWLLQTMSMAGEQIHTTVASAPQVGLTAAR
jgi:hypothetical protein